MRDFGTDWVLNKYIEGCTVEAMYDESMYEKYKEEVHVDLSYKSWRDKCRICYRTFEEKINGSQKDDFIREVKAIIRANTNVTDSGAIEYEDEQLVKVAFANQRLQDKNTQLRRVQRWTARNYNTLEENLDNLVEALKEVDLSNLKTNLDKVSYIKKTNKVGIMQLTDVHVNTLIEGSEANGNEFNFKVCSKRLHKFTDEAIHRFCLEGVDTVYLAMTGDLISSLRRPDEKLATSSSCSMSAVLLTKMIMQIIIRLLANGFKVKVTAVVGNESRLSQEEFNTGAINASENFDWMIFRMLKIIFEFNQFTSDDKLEFISPINPIETLLPIKFTDSDNVFNVVLNHGTLLKGGVHEGVESTIKAKYLANNIIPDLYIFGHLHHFGIVRNSVFAGSVIGETNYSANLGFSSRPSQNVYIINSDKSWYAMPIDLTDCDEYSGLDYEEELADCAYLTRSTGGFKVNISLIN